MVKKRFPVSAYLSKEIANRLNKEIPKGERSQFVENALNKHFKELKERYGKNYIRKLSKINFKRKQDSELLLGLEYL